MTEIVWEDPPTTTRAPSHHGVWAERLAPLRDRPGEWAKVGRVHSATALKIKRGQMLGIPAGEFEATLRDVDRTENKGTLYVRYVGGSDAGASSATSAEVGQ